MHRGVQAWYVLNRSTAAPTRTLNAGREQAMVNTQPTRPPLGADPPRQADAAAGRAPARGSYQATDGPPTRPPGSARGWSSGPAALGQAGYGAALPPAPASLLLVGLVILGLLAAVGCRRPKGEQQPADAVVYARIITMEPTKPRVKGIAIRNGVIVRVATPEALRPLVGDSTRIFNWQRWTIVPGLIDAHVDLLALGESMVGLNLYDAAGVAELAGKVQAVLEERGLGKARWIVGRGWEEHRFRDFTPLDRLALDEVAPKRPVLLFRADHRAAIANSRALELAGIDHDTADPPGGRIEHRNGRVTGLLQGRAVDLVARLLPRPDRETRRALLKAALQRLVKSGFTTVHDMGGDSATWSALKELAEAGELPLRVYASVPFDDPAIEALLKAGPQIGLYDHGLTLRTVRIAMDGDLGSRMALLQAPYSDASRQSGMALHDLPTLMKVAQSTYDAGFQLAVEAHGDGAVSLTLDALERLMPSWTHWNRVRPRLSGADLVDANDASRFGLTHLVAVAQPSRCGRQIHWLGDRLGEERVAQTHPWRSLERGGAIIAFGTGAPELPADARRGFIVAVNREDETGWPPGGWKPMQRLTAPEALRAFTLHAAYAGFEERIKGSIRPGKLADLTVLSRDILYTDPEDLDRVRVVGTVVGGLIRYRTRYLR